MNSRSRTIRRLVVFSLLGFAVAACDDESTGPLLTDLDLDVTAVDFGALDVDFGPGLDRTVTIRNGGSTDVVLGAAALRGGGASDFALAGGAPGALAAGASTEIVVAFDPSTVGSRDATLEIPVEGGPFLTVTLTGSGADFTFRQVDRVGIPALNTVFNHPPQFSKVDYNTASPAADRASYTALFETVLGAVANPDPSGTAALLLPDALPVSLAGATSFATLTGRDLADDAVDVALSVTVGIESLKSDNVDANDRAFLTVFPYLAAAHD